MNSLKMTSNKGPKRTDLPNASINISKTHDKMILTHRIYCTSTLAKILVPLFDHIYLKLNSVLHNP